MVADVESVTVPAGTFTALKLQSTLTWTDCEWDDPHPDHQQLARRRHVDTVKEEVAIAVSGTPPANGYAVSRTLVLESIS